MEKLVKEALRNYSGYVREAEMLRKCAVAGDVQETQALQQAETRVLLMNTSFEFLKDEERFVIQKRLIEGHMWGQVEKEYNAHYKDTATLAPRTLAAYQTRALKKLVRFAQQHREIVLRVFAAKSAA
jgi:hypothetical protein